MQSCLQSTPAVKEGWKLVPIEPTHEMLEAGNKAVEDYISDAIGNLELREESIPQLYTYKAMIFAADSMGE